MLHTRLDHLIVLASTLEEGCTYVADCLGVRPQVGGQHPTMGTHNALLGLYGGAYLEVLATDPSLPEAPHRWFGLGTEASQTRLAQGPFLAHWVVALQRPQQLAALQSQFPQRIAPLQTLQRGNYHWQMGVPADGQFPRTEASTDGIQAGEGLLPSLLQWQTPAHPSQALPASGLALQQLTGFHAYVDVLKPALDWLGVGDLLQLQYTLVEPSLVAEFETPSGVRVLK